MAIEVVGHNNNTVLDQREVIETGKVKRCSGNVCEGRSVAFINSNRIEGEITIWMNEQSNDGSTLKKL